MKLSVFSLFKAPSLIETLRECYADCLEIDYPSSGTYSKAERNNPRLMKIYQTNIKLFYDPDEADLIDELITKFATFNIVLTSRDTPYITTQTKTFKIPILDNKGNPVLEDITCDTCHKLSKQQKVETKVITEKISVIDRRLIFELRD
jgi:hypothetical protein